MRFEVGNKRGFQLPFQLGQITVARVLRRVPIIRRDRSSRPATMVGASDG